MARAAPTRSPRAKGARAVTIRGAVKLMAAAVVRGGGKVGQWSGAMRALRAE
jgi:hypothetical protein